MMDIIHSTIFIVAVLAFATFMLGVTIAFFAALLFPRDD